MKELDKFIFAATNLLSGKDSSPEVVIGEQFETCDELCRRISKEKVWQIGFDGDRQRMYAEEILDNQPG